MVSLTNKRNTKERILISTIAYIAFIGSIIWFAMLLPVPEGTKISIIIGGLVLMQITLYVIFPFIQGTKTLTIDTENKTYSFNKKDFKPYTALKKFEGKTVGNWGTAAARAYASMYITLSDDTGFFKTNDDDAAANFSQQDIEALSEFIEGSSLSTVDKERLSGWLEGVRIKQTPRKTKESRSDSD